MTASEDKIAPGPWISWILALTVWLGWSAFVPDHPAVAKDKGGDEVGLVHQADDVPAPVIQHHPLTGLLPAGGGMGGLWELPAQRLGIEVQGEVFVADPRWGGIQGRAPPVLA